MLFGNIIFGPVKSRRLGTSLGVNLLPEDSKICSFDCIYCECGFNFTNPKHSLPKREEVKIALQNKLEEYIDKGEKIDTITFAGNGEPTLHPQFAEVIDDTIELRNKIFPQAKISVLSNATFSAKDSVFRVLNKVDNNILKLDSAIDSTMRLINQPSDKFTVKYIVDSLSKFDGNVTIQTLFMRGEHNGEKIDNTTEEEVSAWLGALKVIKPKNVMIYTLDRPTPVKTLTKVSKEELYKIAQRVEALGFSTQIND